MAPRAVAPTFCATKKELLNCHLLWQIYLANLFGILFYHSDYEMLQKDLDIKWADNWQMTFNLSKCELVRAQIRSLRSVYYYVCFSIEMMADIVTSY